MNWWQLVVFGAVGFVASIFSGIAGAGGGFVVMPLMILLGLTPAQAVSSGKFNGLSATIGSLGGLRVKYSAIRKRRVAAIMLVAFGVGLIVPHIIKALDNRWYRIILGVLILLMIPIMIRKKVGVKPHTPTLPQKALGGVLLTGSLFLQGAFSGGLGSLVNIVLMGLLGETANEAHVTKRLSQIVLNVTVIFGVAGAGLIVWPVVAVGVSVALVGS